MSRKERPEEAFPGSLMDAENPDSTEENRGLPTFENDGLPSPEQMEKLAKMIQADERMQKDSAFNRAKHPKEKSASAAFKSQVRTMDAMRSIFLEVKGRNKRAGYKVRIFTDEKAAELSEDCDEYVDFCMANGIIPTWALLAVWLGVSVSTLQSVEMVSSKCSAVLQKFRTLIFTILEQSTLQREGNPAAGIFFLKALWGLSDQQPLDVNVHMEGPRQISGRDVQTMIDLTPDEVHEK